MGKMGCSFKMASMRSSQTLEDMNSIFEWWILLRWALSAVRVPISDSTALALNSFQIAVALGSEVQIGDRPLVHHN